MKIGLLGLAVSALATSGCGIEIYENSEPLSQKRGTLTVVNESRRDRIRAEISLSKNDHGHVASIHAEPSSKSTRRYLFSHSECDDYSFEDRCNRKIQFYQNGDLTSYCYGKQVLEIDYRCHEYGCEPIQDHWQDITCHNLD